MSRAPRGLHFDAFPVGEPDLYYRWSWYREEAADSEEFTVVVLNEYGEQAEYLGRRRYEFKGTRYSTTDPTAP